MHAPGLATGGKDTPPMLKVVRDGADGQVEGLGLSLDDLAREGARRMLVAALEAEVADYVERHRHARDESGHGLVVRNGKARPRQVTVGSGTMEIAAPRVNDRRTDAEGNRQRFTSAILPPYMRRSPKVAEVLPILYLRGLSTGDFQEALKALLGEEAAGLSPSNISKLLSGWVEEYQRFRQRDLSDRGYVLHLGGWSSLQHPAGGGPALHARDHGGASGRHEGTDCRRGRVSRVHRELGRGAA
jgi:putative transposase